MVSGLAQVFDFVHVAFRPYQKPYHNHLTFSVSPPRWILQLCIVVSSPDLRHPQSHRLDRHAWNLFVFAMYLTSEIPIVQFSIGKKCKLGCSYALRKVNMNTMIIYQYTLHFEICLLAVLLMLKLDECILKTVVSALVSYDLARYDLAKTAEN